MTYCVQDKANLYFSTFQYFCTMPIHPHLNGTITEIDGECTLSETAVSEKVYLVLWFWFALLTLIGVVQIIFELAIFAIPAFREWYFKANYRGQKKLDFVDGVDYPNYWEKCRIGDWFLLYQIGKNTNEDNFNALILKLELEAPLSCQNKNDPESLGTRLLSCSDKDQKSNKASGEIALSDLNQQSSVQNQNFTESFEEPPSLDIVLITHSKEGEKSNKNTVKITKTNEENIGL